MKILFQSEKPRKEFLTINNERFAVVAVSFGLYLFRIFLIRERDNKTLAIANFLNKPTIEIYEHNPVLNAFEFALISKFRCTFIIKETF